MAHTVNYVPGSGSCGERLTGGVTVLTPSHRLAQRGDHVRLARLPGGAPHDPAGRVEDEHGRRLEHAERTDEFEAGLGVDLHVGDTGDHAGHLGEHTPGGTAGGAEGAGELHECGAGAQVRAEVGRTEPAVAHGAARTGLTGPRAGDGSGLLTSS